MIEDDIDKSVFKVWEEHIITKKVFKYISEEMNRVRNYLLYTNNFDSALYGYNRGIFDICDKILNIEFDDIENIDEFSTGE